MQKENGENGSNGHFHFCIRRSGKLEGVSRDSSDIARYDGKQETITVASRMQFVLVRFYGGKKRGEGIFVGGLFTVNVCRHNTALSREK